LDLAVHREAATHSGHKSGYVTTHYCAPEIGALLAAAQGYAGWRRAKVTVSECCAATMFYSTHLL
jgi:hypothetical protein